MKKIIILILVVLIATAGILIWWKFFSQPKPIACTTEAKICPDGSSVGRTGPNCEFSQCPIKSSSIDYQNLSYGIEEKIITLKNSVSETEVATGSASKIITKIFGNEVAGDLNSDGKNDIAFLLTQETGGSGTFYYTTVAIGNAENSYGLNAILLGDRIAPQSSEIKDGIFIVNFADRNPGEPFSKQPSVGKSKYLKVIDNKLIDITPKIGEAEAKAIAEKSCIKGGESLGPGVYNENSKTWWFDANLNATQPGCNPACVVDTQTERAEINWRCTGLKTE